jgi:hypothetical protein
MRDGGGPKAALVALARKYASSIFSKSAHMLARLQYFFQQPALRFALY